MDCGYTILFLLLVSLKRSEMEEEDLSRPWTKTSQTKSADLFFFLFIWCQLTTFSYFLVFVYSVGTFPISRNPYFALFAMGNIAMSFLTMYIHIMRPHLYTY